MRVTPFFARKLNYNTLFSGKSAKLVLFLDLGLAET